MSFITLVKSMSCRLVCVAHLHIKVCQRLLQNRDVISYGGAVSRALAGCGRGFQGKHPSSGVPRGTVLNMHLTSLQPALLLQHTRRITFQNACKYGIFWFPKDLENTRSCSSHPGRFLILGINLTGVQPALFLTLGQGGKKEAEALDLVTSISWNGKGWCNVVYFN